MTELKSTSTMSAREFNQDLAKAKRATAQGPVIITDRGRPAHVMLSYEAYEQMSEKARGRSAYDVILEANREANVPGIEDIELELPHRSERARIFEFD